MQWPEVIPHRITSQYVTASLEGVQVGNALAEAVCLAGQVIPETKATGLEAPPSDWRRDKWKTLTSVVDVLEAVPNQRPIDAESGC